MNFFDTTDANYDSIGFKDFQKINEKFGNIDIDIIISYYKYFINILMNNPTLITHQNEVYRLFTLIYSQNIDYIEFYFKNKMVPSSFYNAIKEVIKYLYKDAIIPKINQIRFNKNIDTKPYKDLIDISIENNIT